MTRAEIEAEFDRFFEFDNDDRSTVTSVSCRLFAEKIARMVQTKTAQAIADEIKSTPFDTHPTNH